MSSSDLSRFDRWQLRTQQAQMARDLAISGYRKYRQIQHKRLGRNRQYYVSVEEMDDMYERVQDMIVESLDPKERRSLLVESTQEYDSESDTSKYRLQLMYDGKLETWLTIGGHRVRVKVSNEIAPGDVSAPDADSAQWWRELLGGDALSSSSVAVPEAAQSTSRQHMTLSSRVIFTCDTIEARDAVIDKLEEIALSFNKSGRKSRFLVANTGGFWQTRTRLQNRPLDSVILPEDDLEFIVEDLENFTSMEERYVELGLPWHRGYLFYGPPGTGKTSLAAALASHFKFDVYYLPLSSVESDAKLQDLVSGIDAGRSLLILEDIDVVHAARERDDKNKGITLGGLLNALDGVGTPHGLIMVMTTNVRDVLDSALVRPGRVDLEMEVGYVTQDQLNNLVKRFHGKTLDLPAITGDIAPAEIVGFFKAQMDDESLRTALVDLIERRNAGEKPDQVSNKFMPASATTRRKRPIRVASSDDIKGWD